LADFSAILRSAAAVMRSRTSSPPIPSSFAHSASGLAAHISDRLGDFARAHDLAALFVDHLALVVHHVVEF